jgi:hypothetical protein
MKGSGSIRGISQAGPGHGSTEPNWPFSDQGHGGWGVSDVGGKTGRRDNAFYLNEVLLGPLAVHASAQCVSRKIAEQIVGFAGRYIRYTHVLRAEGDEIAEGGIVVALGIRAKELAPW